MKTKKPSTNFKSNNLSATYNQKLSQLDIPFSMPEDYFKFIKDTDDTEIIIKNEKVLRLWDISGCFEMNKAYNIQNYLSNAWAIGDDEGGYAIMYSKEDDKLGLYAISFSDLDNNEKIYLAPSLSDFLINDYGINTFLNL